jgi:hypothetical protein
VVSLRAGAGRLLVCFLQRRSSTTWIAPPFRSHCHSSPKISTSHHKARACCCRLFFLVVCPHANSDWLATCARRRSPPKLHQGRRPTLRPHPQAEFLTVDCLVEADRVLAVAGREAAITKVATTPLDSVDRKFSIYETRQFHSKPPAHPVSGRARKGLFWTAPKLLIWNNRNSAFWAA